jgi:metal-responsive CopG/Arc/MetJ family transcriptional regulator
MGKKVRINICIDKRILERVDEAAKYLDISRSQMIENFCAVGLMDYELFSKLGILKFVKKAQEFRLQIFFPVEETEKG